MQVYPTEEEVNAFTLIAYNIKLDNNSALLFSIYATETLNISRLLLFLKTNLENMVHPIVIFKLNSTKHINKIVIPKNISIVLKNEECA